MVSHNRECPWECTVSDSKKGCGILKLFCMEIRVENYLGDIYKYIKLKIYALQGTLQQLVRLSRKVDVYSIGDPKRYFIWHAQEGFLREMVFDMPKGRL